MCSFKNWLQQKLGNSDSNASENIRFSKDSINSKVTLLLSGSVFGIIIALLLNIIATTVTDETTKVFICFFSNLIENVAGIIFAAGIGTLMLDFFSYIKYAQERIKEVIINKDFLITVNDDEKKKIISTLESSLYFKGEEIPADSLYTNIKEKVVPLLDVEYFERYHTHIDCEIIDGKIHKKIFNDFTIYSQKENSTFKLPFSVYYATDDIENVEKPYIFQNLCFNKEDIDISDSDTEIKDVEQNFDVKKKRYTFQRSLNLKKGFNTISYETISVVDCSDNIYSRTMTLPCKNYVVDFHLKNSDYYVKAHGFAIDVTEDVKIKYFDNVCRIEFTDWVIPGAGCIFIINKKKDNSQQL